MGGYEAPSTTQQLLGLAIATVLLGIWLASIGDRVAIVTGLGQSFVGALLLAGATSLPEVVASIYPFSSE